MYLIDHSGQSDIYIYTIYVYIVHTLPTSQDETLEYIYTTVYTYTRGIDICSIHISR